MKDSPLTISDKLRIARVNRSILDKRARNPRTDPRLAIQAEQERADLDYQIADLEEKIHDARKP